MALIQSDILIHNNPNLAVVDSDFTKGGFRTAVSVKEDLYALSGKTDEPSAAGQLKEYATIVYVTGETKYYILVDINNVGNTNGWEEFQTGGGTLSGATNGLSLINSGTTVVLGGNLTSGTTINGLGLHDLSIINIDEFQVNTNGSSTVFGVDNNGFLLSFSGGSVSFEDNRGILYGGDYSSNYTDRSIVDKGYVDAVAAGLQPKMAVLVASTSGISLSGLQTVDNILLSNGDRVLVKDQVNPVDNGIYIATGSTWQRSSDFDGNPEGEIAQGALIPVLSGNSNQNTLWVLVTPDPITGGTTPLQFTKFSSPIELQGGVGIGITGQTIAVDGQSLAGNSIAWTGNTFNVDISTGTLATALNSKVDGTIFNSYTGTTETRLQGIETDISDLQDDVTGLTATKLDVSIFNGYTGTTNTRLLGIEGEIDYISGVTTTLSVFGAYTGTTNTRLLGIEGEIDDLQTWSGVTDTRLLGIEGEIDYISGVTTTLSVFGAYTGTTNTRLLGIEGEIDDLQTWSGVTNTRLNTIEGQYVTGATNGLSKAGANIKFGGVLTENTTINLSTFDLNFSGDSLQYSADYSAGYNVRSIPDVNYVTGYTQSVVTQNSNILNTIDFSTSTYTATTTSDFIGASGGTTIYLPNPPKAGQRIVVADIGGNALTSPIIINGNTKTIIGTSTATINTDYGSITFIYNSKGFWSAAAFIN